MGIEDLKKLMVDIQEYSEDNVEVNAKEVLEMIKDRFADHFVVEQKISK